MGSCHSYSEVPSLAANEFLEAHFKVLELTFKTRGPHTWRTASPCMYLISPPPPGKKGVIILHEFFNFCRFPVDYQWNWLYALETKDSLVLLFVYLPAVSPVGTLSELAELFLGKALETFRLIIIVDFDIHAKHSSQMPAKDFIAPLPWACLKLWQSPKLERGHTLTFIFCTLREEWCQDWWVIPNHGLAIIYLRKRGGGGSAVSIHCRKGGLVKMPPPPKAHGSFWFPLSSMFWEILEFKASALPRLQWELGIWNSLKLSTRLSHINPEV